MNPNDPYTVPKTGQWRTMTSLLGTYVVGYRATLKHTRSAVHGAGGSSREGESGRCVVVGSGQHVVAGLAVVVMATGGSGNGHK